MAGIGNNVDIHGLTPCPTYTYLPDGQTRTVTDALGNRTVYTYDEAGRRESMLDAELRSTWFRYDALGRQVATVFQNGTLVSNVYDTLGRRVAEIDQAGLRTDFGYNVAGLLTSVTKPGVPNPANRAENVQPVWHYEYDTRGRLLTITDPNSNTTTHTFNEFGRQYSRELPMGGEVETTEYDEYGRIWKQTDFEGQVTEFVYDGFGRTKGKFYFEDDDADDPGMALVYSYDGLGQLTNVLQTFGTETSAFYYASTPPVGWPDHGGGPRFGMPVEGVAILLLFLLVLLLTGILREQRRRLFDGLGEAWAAQRQLEKVYARRRWLPPLGWRLASLGLVAALLGADPNLQMLWTVQASTVPPTDKARSTSFTYDFEGRLIKVTAPEVIIEYGYDLATGRHTSTKTDYSHVEYGHDLLGRLETVRVLKRNGLSVDETTTCTYTPVGSREAVYYPNGVWSFHEYDELNRLTTLTHRTPTNSLLAKYSYVLGDSGRREAAREILLGTNGTTYVTNNMSWGYDDLYRLEAETNGASVVNYEYDLAGNRLKKDEGGSVTSYVYDANDQLTSETNAASVVTSFTYDDNGSLLSEASNGVTTVTYTYDLAKRLASVSRGTNTTSFLYDHQGVRVQSKGYGGTRHFLVDHRNPTGYAQVLEESSTLGGSPVLSYTIGDDVLAQCLGSGNPQWLLYDGHGSTRQLLSNSGAVHARYDFDAYGVATPALPGEGLDTTLLYCGEQYDPVLEQYYLRARYYNPVTGRFNRRDPFDGINHDPQSLHKYAYAHCDPVNGIDPSGMFAMTELIVGLALLAVVATVSLVGVQAYRNSWGLGPGRRGRSVAIVNGLNVEYIGSPRLLTRFMAQLERAGHHPALIENPTEDHLSEILDTYEVVLIFSHGALPNAEPMAPIGYLLGGVSRDPNDDLVGSAAPTRAITANELEARKDTGVWYNNTEIRPDLEVVVSAGCVTAMDDRLHKATGAYVYVGNRDNTNPGAFIPSMQYVVDRLNGVSRIDAETQFRASTPSGEVYSH